ncbi:hypothetical protein LINPERHAP1_LOCUS18833 [Linum perenne]
MGSGWLGTITSAKWLFRLIRRLLSLLLRVKTTRRINMPGRLILSDNFLNVTRTSLFLISTGKVTLRLIIWPTLVTVPLEEFI